MLLNLPEKIAILSSGLFFLSGLLSGVWKYRAMLNSNEHTAPIYVDIAHKASLMYSFACLVLWKLAESSPFSTTVTLTALVAPILFFAIAVATYIWLAIVGKTDNQFRERTFSTTYGMYVLITIEIAGFSVLFGGFIFSQFFL